MFKFALFFFFAFVGSLLWILGELLSPEWNQLNSLKPLTYLMMASPLHACMCACLHEANKNGALIQRKMDFVSVSKQEHVSISYHLICLLETRPCCLPAASCTPVYNLTYFFYRTNSKFP